MRNNCGTVEDVVLNISYQGLWCLSCSAEWNHLENFGREHHEGHFSEIIMNFD